MRTSPATVTVWADSRPPLGFTGVSPRIWVAPDGRFLIEGLPETYYLLRSTAYRKPASPDGERGEIVASYVSRVQVGPKTESVKTVDLGVLELKLRPTAKAE